MRHRDLGFRAGTTHSEIILSAPADRWADAVGYFDIAVASFRPAP